MCSCHSVYLCVIVHYCGCIHVTSQHTRTYTHFLYTNVYCIHALCYNRFREVTSSTCSNLETSLSSEIYNIFKHNLISVVHISSSWNNCSLLNFNFTKNQIESTKSSDAVVFVCLFFQSLYVSIYLILYSFKINLNR